MNHAVYLKLQRRGEDIVAYSFKFGKCENFPATLAQVKSIHWTERSYDPETHTWSVEHSDENLEILCKAFDNFADMVMNLKMQLPLLG